ncbi:protein adenylyltransferase SelO-1, mitochondrial-like [Alosa pseudoharengus]|uniref:protein adenylyltransferase SelO-1, mitochondrial-like n=1 Tax=Alosa pseudoharengus TaxID=34774 RepID=UPI003F898ADD
MHTAAHHFRHKITVYFILSFVILHLSPVRHSVCSELEMMLSMSQANPAMFSIMASKPEVAKQLRKLGRLKELLETNKEDLAAKQRGDWLRWIQRYRRRLARECEKGCDKPNVERLNMKRIQTMDSTKPRFILHNYIAQNAIEAAEKGDFSEVQRVLKLLERPYSAQPGVEHPGWLGQAHQGTCGVGGPGGAEVERNGKDPDSVARCLPYDSKPPSWAREVCVT